MKTHKFVLLLASCFTASLIGCASTPQPINLEYSHTQINFPDKNIGKTINKGDIAYLNYDYESKFTYKSDSEVNTWVALNKIYVPSGANLIKSTLQGKEVFCYNDYIPICLDSNSDKEHFYKAWMAPGAVWFSRDLSPPVKYTTTETYRKKSTPTKIEILFDGYEQNYLSFIYKEFTNQSMLPSLMEPILIKVLDTPTIVNIKNVKIEVTQYTNKTLTFRVLD